MQNVKARTRRTWSMSLEKDEDIAKAKVTRRGFLKGVGAGAAVAAWKSYASCRWGSSR
jgi:hypothetical protein